MAKPRVVADIVNDRPEQTVIVCSAPGKTKADEFKVTDLLFRLADKKSAKKPFQKEITEIINKYKTINSDLDENLVDEILSDLQNDLEKNNGRNFIASRGEYYSALIFSKRINAIFLDASDLFVFDKQGYIDRQKSAVLVKKYISGNQRYVVPGFYGKDSAGRICLFERGGSDRTGAILAASLNYDYENWTDVDGIMNADPAIVGNASVLSELTYEEIREGAHGGTRVFMGDSILDLEYGNCDCIIKNTFNPSAPGTRIKKIRNVENESPVVALSARKDLIGLRIHDLGMRDTQGYLAKIMQTLGRHQISIEHMPAAQDSITITFHEDESTNYDQIQEDVADFLVSPSAYSTITECGVVYLVGERLRKIGDQQRIVIDALQQLENAKIPILAIMMHPDSPSIAVILRREETDEAQKTLFNYFID